MTGVALEAPTISEEYRSEQKRLHDNPRYGVASLAFAPVVKSLLRLGRCSSISDYGAGKCKLKHALGLKDGGRTSYLPYDPAFPEYGSAREADLVTCIDVLEHIEPDALEAVLAELSRITRRLAFLTVHTGPAKKILSDGRNAHLIQESPGWWLHRFEPFFDVLHVQQVRKGFFVIACPKGAFRTLGVNLDLPAISKAAGRRGGRRRKRFSAILAALWI
jgi:hypothetical protein